MKALAIAVASMFVSAPAAAERLYTLWSFDTPGERTFVVDYDQRFFVQRLLPAKLVRTKAAFGTVPAGAMLYAVYGAGRRIVYCTYKNRSLKNQASTLFIPMLDKRPCFIDADGDGRFDSTFSVFDKYGSMATPSGDTAKAQPLAQPLAYQPADPRQAPETMRVAFRIEGGKEPAKARVGVAFDKAGRDKWEQLVGTLPRDGATTTVLNARVSVRSVVGKQATVAVQTEPGALVTGDSGGFLVMARGVPRPL